MSNDDLDLEQENGRNPLRDRMKVLEQENAELKARADAAAEAARELAFVKAGIDPDLPVAKYFMKGYDGEIEVDAIRQAAIEAQIIRDAQAEQTKQEAAAWDRTSKIAAGSGSEPEMDWVTRINQAKSAAEVEQLLQQARAQSE
jgi:CheY-like chemotaxis protein